MYIHLIGILIKTRFEVVDICFADAIVGMEEATYTTNEGTTYFEICVTVTDPPIGCPVIFPFDLIVVASNPDRTDTASG